MEYRLWITIPGLPFTDEDAWGPVIEFLEDRHQDLGPVMSWQKESAIVVIALDSDSEAHAVQRGVEVVSQALHAVGFGDRYPAGVEVDTPTPEPQSLPR